MRYKFQVFFCSLNSKSCLDSKKAIIVRRRKPTHPYQKFYLTIHALMISFEQLVVI